MESQLFHGKTLRIKGLLCASLDHSKRSGTHQITSTSFVDQMASISILISKIVIHAMIWKEVKNTYTVKYTQSALLANLGNKMIWSTIWRHLTHQWSQYHSQNQNLKRKIIPIHLPITRKKLSQIITMINNRMNKTSQITIMTIQTITNRTKIKIKMIMISQIPMIINLTQTQIKNQWINNRIIINKQMISTM